MKAGEGARDCPAYEDETFEHYLWRLAKHRGRLVGDEPEVSIKRGVEMAPAVPLRQPGEEG